MLKRLALGCALLISASSHAMSINPGDTLNAVNVAGTSSIYAIFGHPGSPGDGNPVGVTAAELINFSSGAGNVFTFATSGAIDCCGGAPLDIDPDGASGSTGVTGTNGLSNVSGVGRLPLLGVFTTETDPVGDPAPATLAYNRNNPTSLSPLLHQVFYIGDGRSGLNDIGGAVLEFTAPTNATRLYLGVADAFGFNGLSGYYTDNDGAYAVDVSLAPIPLPAPLVLLAPALFGLMRWTRAI